MDLCECDGTVSVRGCRRGQCGCAGGCTAERAPAKPRLTTRFCTECRATHLSVNKRYLREQKKLGMNVCVICRDAVADTAGVAADGRDDCRHMCCCLACYAHWLSVNGTCPICRGKIVAVVPFFLNLT